MPLPEPEAGSDDTSSPDEEIRQLSLLVGQEAQRILSEEQFKADPALEAQGWERRFMTDGKRAQEAIDLYREMGYEVLTVPVAAEQFDDDCDDCALLAAFQFQTIYIRKRQP